MSSNCEVFACSIYPSPGVWGVRGGEEGGGGEGPSPGALKARVVENLPFGAHDKERMMKWERRNVILELEVTPPFSVYLSRD